MIATYSRLPNERNPQINVPPAVDSIMNSHHLWVNEKLLHYKSMSKIEDYCNEIIEISIFESILEATKEGLVQNIFTFV